MDPMMMEVLASLSPYNLPFFMLSNPQFVEERDINDLKKGIKNFMKYFVAASLIGVTINVQAKRVSDKVLKLPIFVRLPLRLGLFSLPFAFVTQYMSK